MSETAQIPMLSAVVANDTQSMTRKPVVRKSAKSRIKAKAQEVSLRFSQDLR